MERRFCQSQRITDRAARTTAYMIILCTRREADGVDPDFYYQITKLKHILQNQSGEKSSILQRDSK